MAHFAQVRDDTGEVLRVIVIANDEILDDGTESEAMGITRCEEIAALEHPDVRPAYTGATSWVQTSYNHNMRGRYAFIGGTYDTVNDIFCLPQPFPSWTADGTGGWVPPVAQASDEPWSVWDEDGQAWVRPESPFPSWVWNTDGYWEPPVPLPDDANEVAYYSSWVAAPDPE